MNKKKNLKNINFKEKYFDFYNDVKHHSKGFKEDW